MTITGVSGEEVRGEIIGGFSLRWELFYEGRYQSHGYAESDEEAVAAAKAKKAELQAIYKPLGVMAGNDWEVRLRP